MIMLSQTSRPARRRGAASVLTSLAVATAFGLAGRALDRRFGGSVPRREAAQRRREDAKAGVSSTEAHAGKGAPSPVEIPSPGWWSIAKRTFSEVNGDRVLAVAGGVTFYGLL